MFGAYVERVGGLDSWVELGPEKELAGAVGASVSGSDIGSSGSSWSMAVSGLMN